MGQRAYEEYLASQGQADHNEQPLRTSLYGAATVDPDTYAKNVKLGERAGMHPDFVEDLPDEAKERALLGSPVVASLMEKAPRTAAFLTDPVNAKLAHDDIEGLSQVELAVQFMNRDPAKMGPSKSTLGIATPADRELAKRLGGLHGVGSAIVGGVKASGSSISANLAEKGEIFWPEDALRSVGMEGLADAPGYASRYWRREAQRLRGPAPRPGTLASYAGQAAEAVAMSALAAPFGMSAAGGGPALGVFALGAEGGYGELREAGYSPWKAGPLALSRSAMEGLTEKIGLDALYKGGKPVVRKMLRFLLGDLAGEEVNTLYGAIQDRLTLRPEMSWEELGRSMVDTLIVTAMAGGAQGVAFSGAARAADRLAEGMQAREAAQRAREALTVLGDSAKASKLLARMPEKLQEAVAQFKQGGAVQDVGIPVEEWVAFWQNAGLDPAQVAQEVLPDPAAFTEALATGGDVMIPLENYVAHLAGTEHHAGLMPNLRLRPGDMTQREIEAFEENRAEILKEAIDQAEEEPVPSSDTKVYDDIRTQLEAAGRAPDVAAREATLWQVRYRTRAQRLGVDPFDLYRERKVTISGQEKASRRVPGAKSGPSTTPEDGGTTLDQSVPPEDGSDKRGFIRFGPAGEVEIGLLEKADRSTFLHETGHAWLEELRIDATRAEAPEQLRNDWELISKELGLGEIPAGEGIPTEAHERFARAVEAYLMEGKAPSAELQGVFARFRAWLVRIYREIRSLGVELTPEVRGVMDRFVATDEEIAAAEKKQRREPLFLAAEEAGVTAAEFKAYRGSFERANSKAKEQLDRELIAEFTREQGEIWKAERETIRAEVEQESSGNAVFQLYSLLTRGHLLDGSKPAMPVKLSRQSLVTMYGEERVKQFPPKWFRKSDPKGGMHPDLVAEMFGFPSGEEMIRQLLEAPTREEWIEQETDRRMKEKFGDLLHDGSIADAAIDAVHNDETGGVLREELRILQRKRRSPQNQARLEAEASIPPISVFREAARKTVAKKILVQLHPYRYAQAEQKANRKAFKAAGRGDYEQAAREKQKELLNHYLYLEARKAQSEADVILRYMHRLTQRPSQELFGQAGGDFLEQLNGILERYEFRKVPEAQPVRKQETLYEWAQRQKQEGFDPAISEAVFHEEERTNYRALTIEELREVRDAAMSIEHIARESRRLIAEGESVAIGEAFGRLQERLTETIAARKPLPLTSHDETWYAEKSETVKKFLDMFLRPETLIEWMDGGKAGPWHDLVWNLSVDAGVKRNQLRERVLTALKEVLDGIPKDHDARMHQVFKIRGLDGAELSRYTIIGIALNTGNESNLDKLQRGGLWIGETFYPLPDEILEEILSKLDKADWDLVQGMWDAVGVLRPDVVEHSRNVSGVPVKMIEPKSFHTAFGEYAGGYWPMVYDPVHSETGTKQAAANTPMDEIMGKNMTRAHTSKSARTERTAAARPILFDWKRVSTKHVHDVITDISHWRFVYQTRKILADPNIRHTIISRAGESAFRSLEGWLRFTVNGRFDGDPAADVMHRFIDGVITNTAIGALGFKVTTAFGNAVVAPIQAWGEVKAKWILRGMAEYVTGVRKTTEAVHELSPQMRYRKEQLDQTFNEIQARLAGKTSARAKVAEVAMAVHYWSDQITSTAIWTGAYRQATSEGQSAQEAVRFADSVISTTQLAGAPKDLSAFERDPRYRAWRLFLGPMIILQNRIRLEFLRHGIKALVRPESIGKLLAAWIIPSVVYELAVGRGPGDDEDPAEWLLLKILLYPAQMFPFLREASALVETKVRGKYGSYRMDAVSETARSLVELGDAVADYSTGDDDFERALKAGVRASGPVFGLPATQASITGEYIYDVMTGHYSPENPWEGIKYLFVRRQGR